MVWAVKWLIDCSSCDRSRSRSARAVTSPPSLSCLRGPWARPYQTCPPQQVATADGARLAATGPATRPGSAVGLTELTRAWVDIYAWVHADWSPVSAGFEQPLLADFANDLDPIHTRVAATSTIQAAAFVFHDDERPVVVAECRTPTEPAGLDLLRACVRDSLLSLANQGISTITFDGHDTNPHFRPLLDELPTTGQAFELLEWN